MYTDTCILTIKVHVCVIPMCAYVVHLNSLHRSKVFAWYLPFEQEIIVYDHSDERINF